MGRIYPAKKYKNGLYTPLDLGASFWNSPINSDYIVRDKTVIGGVSTDSVAFLADRGNGSGYDLVQPYKNLQPDYVASALNGMPGIHFATAASNANLLSFATGRDFINNVAGLTVAVVLSLPTFTGTQRIVRFNNNAGNLSRLEISAISNNRLQIGGTRLNTDTVTDSVTANNSYSANTPFALVAQLDFTGNALRAWINGTQVINNTTWLNGTGAGTNTAAENMSVAQLGNSICVADWYAGEFCGMKHTAAANIMSATDVARLTTYLKKGAGIA